MDIILCRMRQNSLQERIRDALLVQRPCVRRVRNRRRSHQQRDCLFPADLLQPGRRPGPGPRRLRPPAGAGLRCGLRSARRTLVGPHPHPPRAAPPVPVRLRPPGGALLLLPLGAAGTVRGRPVRLAAGVHHRPAAVADDALGAVQRAAAGAGAGLRRTHPADELLRVRRLVLRDAHLGGHVRVVARGLAGVPGRRRGYCGARVTWTRARWRRWPSASASRWRRP